MSKIKTSRARRSFTPEFKAQAVELVRSSDKTVGHAAKDLDLTETALRGKRSASHICRHRRALRA